MAKQRHGHILQIVRTVIKDELAHVYVHLKNLSVDEQSKQDRTILDVPRRVATWPARFRNEYGQSWSGLPFLTVSRFISKVEEVLILTATRPKVEVVG